MNLTEKKNKFSNIEMYKWAKAIFPICRSITGQGVRDTLHYIKKILPNLKICSVPTGTKVFDWKIPQEWNIKDAYIKNSKGKKIIDFKKNNLHVVSYSTPIHKKIKLNELKPYLYSLPSQPKAIPYVTSYYKKRWGFCLQDSQLKKLKEDLYEVKIKSSLKNGVLNYGELIIPGKSKKEIMLTTNICHPSMANNETSGLVVTTGIAKWLLSLKERNYTYRVTFLPETVGAIAYIKKNLKILKKNVIAGFVLVCIGDNKTYSYLSSRSGNTLADKAIKIGLKKSKVKKYKKYSYLERGSDERQFCSPGIDLPICSFMRSKYHTYSQYHTSLDNLSFISKKGLDGSLQVLKNTISYIENSKNNFKINKKKLKEKKNKCRKKFLNSIYIRRKNLLCEPFLSQYNLYHTLNYNYKAGLGFGYKKEKKTKNNKAQKIFDTRVSSTSPLNEREINIILNIFAYIDGKINLLTLSKKIKSKPFEIHKIAKLLQSKGLIKIKI